MELGASLREKEEWRRSDRPMEISGKVGSVLQGRYRITGFLGRGGMGAVYRAERNDGAFDQVVALKLLGSSFGDDPLAMRRFAQEHGRSLTLADDALRAIESHAWPGNIRELENRIKRATIMADGNQITALDVGFADADNAEGDRSLDLRVAREAAEHRAVLAALARTDGVVAKAADLLGVSRPTLYDLMHRMGLKS